MMDASGTSYSRQSAAGVSAVRLDNDDVVLRSTLHLTIDPLDRTSPISACYVDGG
jgi:hypothetical protein